MDTLSKYKPDYEMQKFLIHRIGYPYPEWEDFVDYKTYFQYDEDSFIRKNWANIYWENKRFNNIKRLCRFDDDYWANEKQKQNAFRIIAEFEYKSEPTPLFYFEIFLMNNNYKMMGFCELNKINPSFYIIGDSYNDNVIKNPRGIAFQRWYKKDNDVVFMGFGCGNTNFYFVDKNLIYYQVPIDKNDFQKAIDGKLKQIP